MNNTMVFDHHGMFIYFDTSSFHVWTSYMNSILYKIGINFLQYKRLFWIFIEWFEFYGGKDVCDVAL
jgi:hypothetical protein